MSLDAMESEIADLRAQAADLGDNYAREQFEISTDPNLTDAGKQDALAPLHENLTTKVAALHQKEKALVKSKREALERTLFGTSGRSTDIVSFRDAQRIAASLTDLEDAHITYTNALRSDDTVLARAIFQQSVGRGWDKITADYLSRNPSAEAAFKDLEGIRRYEQNTLKATIHYMTPGMTTAQPLMPPDIGIGTRR